jgi:hypothetical protein
MSRDAVCMILTFIKHFHKRATADIFFKKSKQLLCFSVFYIVHDGRKGIHETEVSF